MMNFKADETGDTGVVMIEGELTIEYAHELREILLRAMESVDYVVLNLSKMREIDLSCLQLLCSACKSFSRANKCLALDKNRPDIFNRAIMESGYLHRKHYGLECINKNCMWIEE